MQVLENLAYQLIPSQLKNKRVCVQFSLPSSKVILKNIENLFLPEIPDAPEAPKADRVTKDSVTLSWRPPRSDGGSKLKKYIIEKKAKNDKDWSPAGETSGNNPVHTVSFFFFSKIAGFKKIINCGPGDRVMKNTGF